MTLEDLQEWAQNHKIIVILIIIFAFGFVISTSVNMTDNKNVKSSNRIIESKQYINENIYDLWITFISRSSTLTDLQKEEEFKKYNNKLIKSSGIISSIDEVGFGSSNIVVGIESPENPYLMAGTLYFDGSYKNQLINYGIGDEINFEGRIETYNSLMGIIIKDTVLI